jgi:hypothetical protein
LDGADRHPRHKEVDRDHDQQRQENGPRHVPFRVFHLLARLGDDLVPFEGDKGQTHGHDDSQRTFLKKSSKMVRPRLGGFTSKHRVKAESYKHGDHDDFEDGDQAFSLTSLLGTPEVDVDEQKGRKH